jgi:hypothetical protein
MILDYFRGMGRRIMVKLPLTFLTRARATRGKPPAGILCRPAAAASDKPMGQEGRGYANNSRAMMLRWIWLVPS